MAWTFATTMPDAGNPTSPRRTLLVAEDETVFGLQLLQLMENVGWSVVGPAASLPAAESLLTQGRPDAAILNVRIGGASVYPLAERLSAMGVPMIFCSDANARKESEHFEDCVRLSKPVAVHTLYAAVNSLVGDLEAA